MSKKLFLFVVTMVIILSNASWVKAPFCIKETDFDGLIKQKIYAAGEGIPASKDAPLEIRKQEAFIAAFLDGIRNIAEKIAELEKLPTTKVRGKVIFNSLSKKLAGFEVDSQTIIEEAKLVEDVMVVKFGGQRFIIKDFRLISPPVEFVEFPKWDNPPAAISGIKIEALEWKEDEGEPFCTIKLLYHYDATKK